MLNVFSLFANFVFHGQCYVLLSSQMVYLAEKENLCLYGLPNEQWEVNLPAEEVPPELPEPALGINFARDGMQEKDLLSLVAVHSDAWLLSVAFYFGARFGFDRNDRWLFCLLYLVVWILSTGSVVGSVSLIFYLLLFVVIWFLVTFSFLYYRIIHSI